ncbi:hypothetical protein Dimus_022702, partial [Dionaea muscipula]
MWPDLQCSLLGVTAGRPQASLLAKAYVKRCYLAVARMGGHWPLANSPPPSCCSLELAEEDDGARWMSSFTARNLSWYSLKLPVRKRNWCAAGRCTARCSLFDGEELVTALAARRKSVHRPYIYIWCSPEACSCRRPAARTAWSRCSCPRLSRCSSHCSLV